MFWCSDSLSLRFYDLCDRLLPFSVGHSINGGMTRMTVCIGRCEAEVLTNDNMSIILETWTLSKPLQHLMLFHRILACACSACWWNMDRTVRPPEC